MSHLSSDHTYQSKPSGNSPADDSRELFRIILQVKKQEEKKREREAIEFKAKHIKLKKSGSDRQQLSRQEEEEKRQRENQAKILGKISQALEKYRSLYYRNADSQIDKMRNEGRFKVFKYIMYGTEESKHMTGNEEGDMQLAQLNAYQRYNLARNISAEIDSELIAITNRNNRSTVSKYLKIQWKNIMNNIQDPLNYQLRKKIALRIYTPKMLATIEDIDLYNDSKRKLVQEKRNRLVEESIVQNKTHTDMPEEPSVKEEEFEMREEKANEKYYKHLGNSTIFELLFYLKPNFLARTQKMLEDTLDPAKPYYQPILNNFIHLFPEIQ